MRDEAIPEEHAVGRRETGQPCVVRALRGRRRVRDREDPLGLVSGRSKVEAELARRGSGASDGRPVLPLEVPLSFPCPPRAETFRSALHRMFD